jgi:purine-binding chemotaxis protein CheW
MNPSPASQSGVSTAPSLAPNLDAVNAIQEFLAFKLGSEEYGIDILRVQEIRSYEAPTRMANTPAFIKGVINLRGVIVPIIDMRLKFNLDQANYDGFTVVIVLNIGRQVVGQSNCTRCRSLHRPSAAITCWPSARSKTAC